VKGIDIPKILYKNFPRIKFLLKIKSKIYPVTIGGSISGKEKRVSNIILKKDEHFLKK